jgi:hypothetical protein
LLEWVCFSLRKLQLALGSGRSQPQRRRHTEDWIAVFQELWRASGDELLRQGLYADAEIQSLLTSLGLRERVNAFTFHDVVLEKQRYRYREELVAFLFEKRFPRPLNAREGQLLRLIAEHFPDGFSQEQLQQVIKRELTWQPPGPQLLSYIVLFNEIHAISYDLANQRFVMDKWLQAFLSGQARASNGERPQ